MNKLRHAVQFYSDNRSLASTVAVFLCEGLRQGDAAVIIATPEHTEEIVRGVHAQGFDCPELFRDGALHTVDADRMLAEFMDGGQPDSAKFKVVAGSVIERLCAGRRPCSVRAYGEMVDLLWQKGNADGAIGLELLWDQLMLSYDLSLLCGYDFGHFYRTVDERCQQVCDLHSHVVPAV